MSDYTQEYTMGDLDPSELTETDLVNTFNSLEKGEEVEAYRIRFIGERAEDAGGQTAELLYLPHRGRGGVGWAGEVVWTDASSAAEVMERYLDHDIVEDNQPGV